MEYSLLAAPALLEMRDYAEKQAGVESLPAITCCQRRNPGSKALRGPLNSPYDYINSKPTLYL